MADYKISLGVQLQTDDIISQINEAERKVDPITIKVDAETKELTKSIQDALKTLSGGTKNALTLDTSKFEGSIADIKSAVVDLKKVLGTLDDSANMKSLLSSVNQIANAIGKVTDESETLAKSLSILSKKDFGFNFNLKTGNANPIKAATDYGIEARRKAIPAMQEQVAFLQDIIGGTEKADKALERYLVKQNKGFGGVREKERLQREMLGGVDLDGKTVSISKQMGAYEQTISLLKKIAIESGKSLDGFDAHFSKAAENIVDDTVKIQTGVKQTEEALESAANEMKQIFSMGVGADQLSAQLEPIVSDLNQIREAVQNLSKSVSLDGLTASFDRLSGAIENLLANAEKVKGVLNNGFDGSVGSTSTSTPSSTPSTTPIKSAQQTGQQIGEAITKSAQQSINLDDVIDKQVLDLMNKFSIAGDKGSDAFNSIKQAVVECRTELSKIKNSDIGIDEEVFDTSRAVDKVTDAIANQHRVANDLGDEYVALANYMAKFNDPKKGNKVRLPDFVKQEQGGDYVSNRGSLGIAFNAERGISFVDFINDLNHELPGTIDLTKGEAEAMDELLRKVEIGRQQRDALKKSENYRTSTASTEEILKQNGIDRNEIYDDVMSIVGVVDTAEQKIAQSSAEMASESAQSGEKIGQTYRETSGVIDNLKTTLETMRVDRSSIDTIVKDMEELGFTAKNTSVEMKNGKFDITVNGIDDIGRAITEIRRFDSATDEISLVGRKISQPLIESDKFIKQQKKSVADLTNQINQLNRSAIDQNANRPIKDSTHLDILEGKYNEITSAIQKMGNASSNTFDEEVNNVRTLISEYKSLTKEFKNAENVSTKMKGTDFGSGLDIAKNDLEKFKAEAKDFPQITATVKELDKAIEGVGDAASLNKFNDQLRVARSELAKVKSETAALNRSEKVGINTSGLESKIADLQRISPEIDKFETEIDGAKVSVQSLINDLKQVKTQGDFSTVNARFRAFKEAASAAGIAVAEVAKKVKSIDDIKLDFELGNYDNQISQMYDGFDRLSSASVELRESVRQVETAYRAMEIALEGTGDEVADRKRLAQAEKEYAMSLEKTNNLIRIQAREQRKVEEIQRLDDRRKNFQLEIDNYLTKYSAAVNKYGDKLLKLKATAESCDRVELNHLISEFKQLDKQIDKAGLKMQSLPDRIKSKFKEYSAYFSVAEVFMWVEQGLREMFNTVKEIDTAMTGLYRVTDLTSSEYDALFNNMIDSAKEYGATLNDIINATTDWVRAGFDANTALGMAEITTMYQHISDLDYDTAAENLLTAYNGFKDELNGLFGGDEVASVNYIADILNELDNNFAVTSAGLGEALKRSASALDLAGNSIQETAG